jgi:hypothetical protein
MNLSFYPPLGATTAISLHDDVPGEQFKLYVTLNIDDYLSLRRSGTRIEAWTNLPIDGEINKSRWTGIPFEADCPRGIGSPAEGESIEGGKDNVLWPKVALGGSDMQISLAAILPVPTVESEFAYTFRIVRPPGVQWLGNTKNNGTLVFKKDEVESSVIEKPTLSNWEVIYEDAAATVLSSPATADDSISGNAYALGRTIRVYPTTFDPSRIFYLPVSVIRDTQHSATSMVIYSHHHEARFLHRDDSNPLKIGMRTAGVELTVLPTHILRSEDEEKAEAWNIAIIHPSSYHSTLTHVVSEVPSSSNDHVNGHSNGDATHSMDLTSSSSDRSQTNLQQSQYNALVESIPMLQRLLSLLLLYVIRLGILSGLPWLYGPVSSDPFDSKPSSPPKPVYQDHKPKPVEPPRSAVIEQRRLPRFTFVFPWWTSSEGIKFILHPPASAVDSFQDVGVRVGDDKIALSRANVGVKVEKLDGMEGWLVSIDGVESDVGQRLEVGLTA